MCRVILESLCFPFSGSTDGFSLVLVSFGQGVHPASRLSWRCSVCEAASMSSDMELSLRLNLGPMRPQEKPVG